MSPKGVSYDDYKRHDELGNCPELLSDADREAIAALADGPWRRTCGDCVCSACGKVYYDHPSVLGALWLTRLCDGRLVKL